MAKLTWINNKGNFDLEKEKFFFDSSTISLGSSINFPRHLKLAAESLEGEIRPLHEALELLKQTAGTLPITLIIQRARGNPEDGTINIQLGEPGKIGVHLWKLIRFREL